jgi:hypothetical protein
MSKSKTSGVGNEDLESGVRALLYDLEVLVPRGRSGSQSVLIHCNLISSIPRGSSPGSTPNMVESRKKRKVASVLHVFRANESEISQVSRVVGSPG